MISYALLSLFVLTTINGDQLPEETVKLLTKNNGNYKASFTYTIENFLELPYVERAPFFETALFATRSNSLVKWCYQIEPGFTVESKEESVNLNLKLWALPRNIDSILSSAKCAILDIKGNKQHEKYSNELSLQVEDRFHFQSFITRAELERSRQQLLPAGHLTIECDVEGVLKINISATNFIIPTEEVKDSFVSTLECAKAIGVDTLNRLSLFDVDILGHVELKSSEKSFKCHKDILSARSLYFKALLLETGDREDVVHDLSEDVNDLELEDMVQFNYRGRASNLSKTCRVLYSVSKRYRMDCLNVMCENVLDGQINSKNAQEYLKFAQDMGSQKLTSTAAYCIYSPTSPSCR